MGYLVGLRQVLGVKLHGFGRLLHRLLFAYA